MVIVSKYFFFSKYFLSLVFSLLVELILFDTYCYHKYVCFYVPNIPIGFYILTFDGINVIVNFNY